jgi:circadian clock protein KaiC
LNVLKIRGRRFREGFHDVALRQGGLVVFPRLAAAEHHSKFKRGSFPSGIAGLDELLGGGLDRGTSNMFLGPPGTGKSTLAVKFAHAAAELGEMVHFFVFDETVETMLARAAKLGTRLEAHVKNGLIKIEKIDPAEITPGELAAKICHAVQKNAARMVVLDSLNGYLNAMPDQRFLNLQLHEVLAFLNQQGVITIMLLAQQGIIGMQQSVIDLTYLADTVILLRYFEAQGEVRQAVSIIKKRSGNHERSIREIKFARGGMQVGAPLTNMQGVLTGVPSFRGVPDKPSSHDRP